MDLIHIPKTHYNRFPNLLQTGEKLFLVFGLCAVVTAPRPVGSATLLKILGVVLELCCFRETTFLLQQAPNTHLWLVPEPLAATHCLCCFRLSIILFVLSLCCTSSAQVMQGLPTIIQWFPFCRHFSILAFTLSLVSELSVPHSSVHLHSSLLMPPASSIKPLNNWCVFIADLRSEVVTAPFSSSPLLFGYISAKGRSEVFPPIGYPDTYSNAGENTQ